MKIVLQPVIKLDNDTLNHLAYDIASEFENKATVSVGKLIKPYSERHFKSAFETNRNQWNSFKLLEWLLKKFNPKRGAKILGIFDIDSYSDGFDFVFGEAFYKGKLAAVYLPRLKLEFYSLKPNSLLFYERSLKEAVHELGQKRIIVISYLV